MRNYTVQSFLVETDPEGIRKERPADSLSATEIAEVMKAWSKNLRVAGYILTKGEQK